MKYISFIIATITPSLCQYALETGLRPDVTFDDSNNRFDVSNLIRQQKHYSSPNLDPQSEEYRRRYKSGQSDNSWTKLLTSEKGRGVLKRRIKKRLADEVNEIANTIIKNIKQFRRNDDEFAYHDNMNSEGGDLEDFNDNLREFDSIQDFKENNIDKESEKRRYHLQGIVDKLHETNQTRRVLMDPEKEILLHYAFPVDMKIEGFLQAPLD